MYDTTELYGSQDLQSEKYIRECQNLQWRIWFKTLQLGHRKPLISLFFPCLLSFFPSIYPAKQSLNLELQPCPRHEVIEEEALRTENMRLRELQHITLNSFLDRFIRQTSKSMYSQTYGPTSILSTQNRSEQSSNRNLVSTFRLRKQWICLLTETERCFLMKASRGFEESSSDDGQLC